MKQLKILLFLALSAIAVPKTLAETVSGTCGMYGDNLTWTYNTSTGELSINGEGRMKDFDGAYATPWLTKRDLVKTISISNGVTSIGKYAFSGFSRLASVVISGSVMGIIGDCAFSGCSKLGSVTIPKSVTSIGNYAFQGCI